MDKLDNPRDLINKINLVLEKDRDRLSADDKMLLQEAVTVLEDLCRKTERVDRLTVPRFVVVAEVIAKLLKFFYDVL